MKHICWSHLGGLVNTLQTRSQQQAYRQRPSCRPAACGTCGHSRCCRHSSRPQPRTLHAGRMLAEPPQICCSAPADILMHAWRLSSWEGLEAPLLVQNWMPRENAVLAAAVGPPWILTSSGGASPAAHREVSSVATMFSSNETNGGMLTDEQQAALRILMFTAWSYPWRPHLEAGSPCSLAGSGSCTPSCRPWLGKRWSLAATGSPGLPAKAGQAREYCCSVQQHIDCWGAACHSVHLLYQTCGSAYCEHSCAASGIRTAHLRPAGLLQRLPLLRGGRHELIH